MEYVALACRCLTGVVFATAVIGKLRGRPAFEAFTAALRELVPPANPKRLAPLVIAIEAAVVALLVHPATVVAGSVLAMAALAGFTAAIRRALRRGVRTPCRCFGGPAAPLSPVHLLRNGLLLTAATGSALGHLASSTGPPHPARVVLSLAAAAVLSVVILALDDISALLRSPESPGRPWRTP